MVRTLSKTIKRSGLLSSNFGFLMRKLIFLLLIFNATITKAQYVDINAIEIPIGYYTSEGQKKTVYAVTSADTSEIKAVAIIPTLLLNKRMDLHNKRIIIPYNNSNIEKLEQVKAKYAEWTQIAIKEKAPMMMKTIDIEIPQIYVLTYYIAADRPRQDDYHILLNSRKFNFIIPNRADKMPMLELSLRGKDPSRDGSEIVGSHTFYAVSEIEELLSLIEPDSLKGKIKNKTIDKLFK